MKQSDVFKNKENARVFEYQLNEKTAKAKLVKGEKGKLLTWRRILGHQI